MTRRLEGLRLIAPCLSLLLAPSVGGMGAGETAARLWPLAVEPALTSTFGEHRFGYFHSGIDLTTWGVTGAPVVAMGDGHVERIRASGVGYGRAVYVRLDDGLLVLYAHLESFAPALDAYVRAEQERLGRYEVDLAPEPGRLPVRRGEIVAYTGESGAGPPHLHLEMRNGAGDVAVNPLRLLDAPVVDTRRPTLVDVSVVPAAAHTLVDGGAEPIVLPLRTDGDGAYAADSVTVTGPVVLAVHVFDKAEGKELRLAVYGLELRVDGELRYAARLDSVPYTRQREVDLVYDAVRVAEGQRRVRRLYRPTGSRIEVHGTSDGRIDLAGTGRPRRVEIRAFDYFGNTSEATLVLRPEVPQLAAGAVDSLPADEAPMARPPGFEADLRTGVDHVVLDVVAPEPIVSLRTAGVSSASGRIDAQVLQTGDARAIVRFPSDAVAGPLRLELVGRGREGRPFTSQVDLPIHAVGPASGSTLEAPGASLHVGSDAFFAPECVLLERVSGPDVVTDGLARVSEVYRVGPTGLVVDRAMRLTLEPSDTTGLARVAVYVRHPRRPLWVHMGGRAANGKVGTTIRGTGRFCLIRDDTPPTIRSVRPRDGARIEDARPTIRVRLGDVGSGLGWRDLELELDGRPLIAEWDPEAGELRAPLRATLAKGEHVVRVRATDQAGNSSERQTSFTVVTP